MVVILTRIAYYASAIVGCLISLTAASAQSGMGSVLPVQHKTLDDNQVNMINGSVSVSSSDISIGNGDEGLVYKRFWSSGWRSNFIFKTLTSDLGVDVMIGDKIYKFLVTSGGFVNLSGDGSSLVEISDGFTFFDSVGTRIDFRKGIQGLPFYSNQTSSGVKMTRANGEIVDLYYSSPVGNPITVSSLGPARLSSIVSSRGYQLKLVYNFTDYSNQFSVFDFSHPDKVIAINNTVSRCDYFATACSELGPGKSYVSYQGDEQGDYRTETVVRPTGPSGYFRIYRPYLYLVSVRDQRDVAGIEYTYFDPRTELGGLSHLTGVGTIKSVSKQNATWNYRYSFGSLAQCQVSYGLIAKITNPLGGIKTLSGSEDGSITCSIDETNNVTRFEYYGSKIARVIYPEGNEQLYGFDSRGNYISSRLKPKSSPSLPDLVSSATFSATCSAIVSCNKPLSFTDANQNSTNYTYSSIHGGITEEILPPSQGGVRPVKRFSYIQRSSRSLNSAGVLQANPPIWVLSTEKTCRLSVTVGDSCSLGITDQVTLSYDYGPDAGATNLLLRGQIIEAGGVVRRTCYAFDIQGNKISESSARSGLTSCL